MSTKHQPATPLPFAVQEWERENELSITGENGDGDVVAWVRPVSVPMEEGCRVDAAYIAHAANAYPRLVEALREFSGHLDLLKGDMPAIMYPRCEEARALLRELGEDA